jgi:hypothetical protein
MSEMGLHDPFEHLKHKLWPKERSGVKLAVWLPTTKPLNVGKRPDFLAYRWRATYRWKAFDKAYNFALRLISIGDLKRKLWAPKVVRVPSLRISRLPLGNPETKSHLNVGLMERDRVYYKGEGGGFPQVWAVVSLVSPSCPWLILAPKVLQLHTNHLVLVLCRSVWVSEACQSFLVPSRSSNTPLYPSKVLRTRERAPTLCSSAIFYWGLTFESSKELGAHQYHNHFWMDFNIYLLNMYIKILFKMVIFHMGFLGH